LMELECGDGERRSGELGVGCVLRAEVDGVRLLLIERRGEFKTVGAWRCGSASPVGCE
jgi:hypothetical protein